MNETTNVAAWRRIKNTAAIVIHRWTEERRAGVLERVAKCVTAPVRAKQKAWRLSRVAADDLIARALILAELKHRPFLDLLAEIGDREVFAVLIDALDVRGEPPESADVAAERIRALHVADDAEAMQQVIGERDRLVRDAATMTRNKDEQRRTASESSKQSRTAVAARRQAVARKIGGLLRSEHDCALHGLPTQVRAVIERANRGDFADTPGIDALIRMGWRSSDWRHIPTLRAFQQWRRAPA